MSERLMPRRQEKEKVALHEMMMRMGEENKRLRAALIEIRNCMGDVSCLGWGEPEEILDIINAALNPPADGGKE